jgi:hypothetical protein
VAVPCPCGVSVELPPGSNANSLAATVEEAATVAKLEKEVKKAISKGGKGGKKGDKKGSAGPEKQAKNAAKRILK